MPRPSPQTDRVVAVLELLTERPEGATMTEIATALDLSQSTCVHLLAALAGGGVVIREPDRRYFLGPALVRPGELAAQRYPLLAVARDEMVRMSEQHGFGCMAFVPDGEHARLVLHTGDGPPPIRLGDTIPVTPPLGIVFVAWARERDFDAWLSLDPGMTPDRAVQHRSWRSVVRRLGFVAQLAPAAAREEGLVDILDERASPYRDGQLHRALAGDRWDEYVLTELDDPTARQVTDISAPAFDAGGRVSLSINLVTVAEPLGPEAIRAAGAAVRAATDRVTRAVGGRIPRRRT
jgi:DNA-binding IclR family transcriptional regulator